MSRLWLRLAAIIIAPALAVTGLVGPHQPSTSHFSLSAAVPASAVASQPLSKPQLDGQPAAVSRPATSGGHSGGAGVPGQGTPPPVIQSASGASVNGIKSSTTAPVAPTALPAHGSLAGPAAAVAPGSKAASWNGSRPVANPAMTAPATHLQPLGIPTAGSPSAANAFPTAIGAAKQVDTYAGCSSFGANEPTTAQSTANPNLIVAGFQAYQHNGTCGDSHAFAAVSNDAGLHWSQNELPNLQDPASGDVGVAYDAVRNVFVFNFIEFTRDGAGNPIPPGRLGVKASGDGVNWGLDSTLATTTASDFIDKPGITSDANPSSPHYGRVAVTWTDFGPSGQFFYDAFTDNGGASWSFGTTSINFSSSNCGNGTSPSFDASGGLMVAWFDCNGGNSLREELSTDGGATWPAPADTVITAVNDTGAAGSGGSCLMNNGGSAFRCNSFPSLAGDPNSADEGGQAFIIAWADAESTTQSGITRTISQTRSLTSLNGGGGWGTPAFMNFDDFGDKFFPAIAFAPNGRLNMTFSDREDSATTSNPNGFTYDQWNTEAGSLASLVADSYITFRADSTLQNPGSRAFIGDYSSTTSRDNNFDTLPIYTATNGSFNNVLTQDLCYLDCFSALAPYTPVSGGSTSAFDDRYQFNTSASIGSGNDFWNAVGIREGADGTSVDDDMFLYGNRYFSSLLAVAAASPPINDYIMENDNAGHSPSGPYYQQIHGFTPGPYTAEWAAGHIVVSPGTGRADSMGSSNVVRVYDSFLSTGTTYGVGLRPAGGNTSGYSLALHSASRGNDQGRSSAAADSGNLAAGQAGFITYATGADASQFDGIVVLNNNGGTGSYSVYVDNAKPTGTININSGAAYTKTTAVTLNLSATNPNSGDPVLDMRFSNDGSSFGSWVPYSTSASYVLPSGDGAHTVFVQFRNGAGLVSATASHAIILDSVAPATTAGLSGTPNGCGNYFSPVQVTLTATDATSGVAATFYQLDGGALTPYTVPFNVPTAGGHTVTFHSTDHAGNVEATETATFTIQNPMILDNPTSGNVGKTIAITGTGFMSGETVNLYWDSTANPAIASTTASSACAISKSFNAPASPNGTHTIIAKGVTSGRTASVNFTIKDGIKLSPSSGHTGATVSVKGTGFNAAQSITLYWNANPGPVLGTATTDATGTFTKNIVIPAVPNGAYKVYAVGSSPTLSVSSTFTVTPFVSLSPTSGHQGTTTTVSGTGFHASQTVTIKWNCSSSSCSSVTVLATPTSTATGTFSVVVTIPTAALGSYPIGAKDSSGAFASATFTVN